MRLNKIQMRSLTGSPNRRGAPAEGFSEEKFRACFPIMRRNILSMDKHKSRKYSLHKNRSETNSDYVSYRVNEIEM